MRNRLPAIADDSDVQSLTKIVVFEQPIEYDASDPAKGLVVTKTRRVVMLGDVIRSYESIGPS